MNREAVARELVKLARELVAGPFRRGVRNEDWVVTQYEPVWFDDLGGAHDGYAKVVNQETGDVFEMQHDHALRGAKWWTSVNRKRFEDKTPLKLFFEITDTLAGF